MLWIAIVFLSSSLLVTARTRSERGGEDYALEPSHESSKEIYDGLKDRQSWNSLYDKDLYTILNQFKEKADSSGLKLPRKRALSALSRWKPLGSLGIRMKSIHRPSARAPMISMLPEMNLISAESEEGVRPLGQPLRWGRKR